MSASAKDKETANKRAKDAHTWLCQLLSPNDTIYGIVRSVSKSGMSRRIDFYVIKDNVPLFLTASMVNIGIGSYPNNPRSYMRGLRVNGCGMDMIFSCVNDLSQSINIALQSAQL